MTEKPDLHSDEWEQVLQQALADLPTEPMPASLQNKLQRIPRDHAERHPWWRASWLRPAFAFGVIAVPLAVALMAQQQQIQRQEQQLAQAQQDLAIALTYLQKANEQVASQMAASIGSGVARPVTDTTIQVIEKPLDTTREYEL
ncbi:hypothetical protein BST95_07195 [Halioglobus japonicus]|uniref:Uncharacterized protein n=1 Tax=Halioglobus japonicus TaxID=930805 RepID=A0AAP8MDX3_9GAMM|nr:hypothetical protein [Halioglobus japonicus]AQA18059.1 hypothetical protein BST95_07195 [Halioglobus japonicus]PLW86050.1 hypothetical protein C0029_06240 [Halioglobus japonicus]GHD14742.1 hypothetical protein GCM10007052_18830 [Halioglobus japonicus]